MWLFLTNAFLSIVQHDDHPTALLVRARMKGDIERIFATAAVTETSHADYRFRAVIPRAEVARAIAEEACKINYTNFKDSVKEKDRHDAYMKCWSVMWRLQEQRLKPR